MEEKPVFEVMQTTPDDDRVMKKRLFVFEDRIELHEPGVFKSTSQTMRYDQIAQVATKAGWFSADLVIESRGGGTIYVKKVGKADADRVREFINERLGRPVVSQVIERPEAVPVGSPGGAPDIPDQIRKLAELKDAGILTEEEFEAKKQALLKRM